ncbi:putative cyclic nucleotide-gated ion channel 20, chloroplastic [Stylosanthes scabra]|uniref:Cyclic nucleotide-gated ion channel 20, chloroplastic n=1 Tax=Stylosanthes scabra TaxID=79078 RepID=A0ABU6Q9D7_9FABA|nr:putative cyclic nucleotide-gated ion channel 20, chloroplastic [Stylosanthes scabra]
MASDELPMMMLGKGKDAEEEYDETLNSKLQKFLSRTESSIAIPVPVRSTETSVAGHSHTGPLLMQSMAFRLAYVSPETRVVGTGDLEDHPKKIALHYLGGYFFLDLFAVLPLPQIMVLFVLPKSFGGANYAKNLLRAVILVQYIPRLCRFLPMLIGQSPSGFVFESAWANFIINLLIFMLSGHVVGACWYLFGLQRVNQCLRDACHNSNIPGCMAFIDCGHGQPYQTSNE